ncbi:YraN family protein [Georgenia satyanarayanai]|uniref:YraN family protein n=1 Tax=Georgenia satyanarayanai TaxID=860221 RepID=UPI001265892D|nr:YraN family protein [Georgenia satyanarayanai]
MAAKDEVGARGERIAAAMLHEDGYEILERNWRCREGEIDIVARDPRSDAIAFVEVKTRSGTGFGHPAEAVGPAKLERLRRLAGRWLSEHGTRAAEVRIDVVAVLSRRGRPALVEHLRGVG